MFIDPAEEFQGTVLIAAPHMDDEVLACEQCASDAREPALLGTLEAHGRALPRSGCERLGRVPVSRSGRRRAKG